MESPHLPVTETYPLELHIVKALLLQKQYRQCIKACHDILQATSAAERDAPLQHTFAQFYLALAHDELARAMHTFLQAKVSAFDQAEQFYREALTSLPSAEDCLPLPEEDSKPASRHDTPSEEDSSHLSTFGHARSQSDMGSMSMSPPTHIRNDSLPMRSPPLNSPEPADSELDELESHDSFGQIMTPTRLPKLERDYSSMTLLQAPHQQQHHALMKPVRLGSPAKPYFSPPTRSQTLPSRSGRRSMLPRIDTSPGVSDAVRKQLRTRSEENSPIDDFSPVSPLGSEGDTVVSDASTISPISPDTPSGLQWGDANSDSIQAIRLVDSHLQAMRTQLQSHLKLLQEAKQRTLDQQTERLTAKLNPSKASNFNRVREGSKLQQSMSYWSFTPEDQKVLEKQRRVQAGRERGWMKARFDPTRYDLLADAALSEL